jgi:hypothetical protein
MAQSWTELPCCISGSFLQFAQQFEMLPSAIHQDIEVLSCVGNNSYKSKLDMTAFKKRYDLDLEPLDSFGPEEVEARHRLLVKLVEIIWS